MSIFLWVFSCALVAMTFLPYLNVDHWCVRALDFPRLQIFILLLFSLAACLLLLEIESFLNVILIVAVSAAVLSQLTWILPYSIFFPCKVKKVGREANDFALTLLSANVLMSNRKSERLIALIEKHNPDIVVTLESDLWWEEKLKAVESNYPYTLKCPLDNLYGMHLYSKIKLFDPQVKFLVEEGKPSMHAAIKLPDETYARLHFLHPAPPSPTENETSSERDAELLVLAKDLENVDEPVVVAGDLNDVAWSRTTRAFLRISGLLDPRIGRGRYNTFHADYWFIRWPLDHLFHSHHFKIGLIKRLGNIGSDHFPLLSRLHYQPQNNQEKTEEAHAETEQWAEEKIAQEPVQVSDVPNPKG